MALTRPPSHQGAPTAPRQCRHPSDRGNPPGGRRKAARPGPGRILRHQPHRQRRHWKGYHPHQQPRCGQRARRQPHRRRPAGTRHPGPRAWHPQSGETHPQPRQHHPPGGGGGPRPPEQPHAPPRTTSRVGQPPEPSPRSPGDDRRPSIGPARLHPSVACTSATLSAPLHLRSQQEDGQAPDGKLCQR